MGSPHSYLRCYKSNASLSIDTGKFYIFFFYEKRNNFQGKKGKKTGGKETNRIRPATAGTSIPQDHDGGSGSAGLASRPALPEVRAPGLFAHRVELEFPEFGLDGGVLGAPRVGLLHPLWLGKRPLLSPYLNGVDEIREGGRFLG